MENKTQEYTILSNFERKVDALECSSCLLSLNAMSMSLSVDVCQMTKYFELLLKSWQECLPLGDASDVQFSIWGNKMWEIIQKVRHAFFMYNIHLNQYEYESACFLDFKNLQDVVGPTDDSMLPLQMVKEGDSGIILVCALRKLSEVLLEISEFLNSPTEEQIMNSFDQWWECYLKHYHKPCQKRYNKWKIQYTNRTLKKHLQERIDKETEAFRKMFMNDDEFEMVYDSEQKVIDIEGVSRFLFTNTERFGVSHIDNRPLFSKELLKLFSFVDLLTMMQCDLQPKRKQAERAVAPVVVDELEEKVMELVDKIRHLVAEPWAQHLPKLWKTIFTHFRNNISKAGPHETFKEYSKKTLYCIIGHLKMKGVYQQEVSYVELTKCLEGANNGKRKYLNNGLVELEPSLKQRIESFVEQEIQKLQTKSR